jgi:hypothetical protein
MQELRAQGLAFKGQGARSAAGRFTFANSPTMLYAATAGKGITKRIAGRAVRAVRGVIRRKNIIDTGNLLGSIAEGRNVAEMKARSESRLILPDSAAES